MNTKHTVIQGNIYQINEAERLIKLILNININSHIIDKN
jgi:hypothetical protein